MKIGDILSDCIGQENAENLVNMLQRAKQRAIERSANQTVEVIIDVKGYVRHINGSDNVNGVKPKMYASE